MRRLLFVLLAAIACTWLYYTLSVTTLPPDKFIDKPANIAAGDANAPLAYRLLTAHVIVALGNTVATDILYHGVMFAALLWLLSRWATAWGGNGVVAVLLTVPVMAVTFPTYYGNHYTVTSWVLYAAALVLLMREDNRYTVPGFVILLALATINDEKTAVLLMVAWLTLKPSQWRLLPLYALLVAGLYGGLRLAVGPRDNVYTLAYVLQLNLTEWRFINAVALNTLLAPSWMLIALRWRFVHPRLQRLILLTVAVYLPLLLVFGVWQEVRLFMPLWVVAVPVAARLQARKVDTVSRLLV